MSEQPIQRSDRRLRAGLSAARHRLGLFRYSMAHYLVGLILVIITAPLVGIFDQGLLIESLIMTAVLVSGVIAVGGKRRAMVGAIILITPALAGRWQHQLDPGLLPPWLFMSCTVLFMVYLLFHLLMFIVRAPRVSSEVLCAGIATYLTLGIAFGVLFDLVESLHPGSLALGGTVGDTAAVRGFATVYFSFITLATVGFGDITPVTPTARMLAIVESMVGTFYMAILVARLVSLYAANKPAPG
jgi:hypothetical protein